MSYCMRLLLALAIACCALPSAHADEVFFIAGDRDERPFGYLDKNNKFVGVYVDIAREVFKRMNIKLKHEPFPWARAQHLVKTNQADAMVTVYTEARKKFTTAVETPMARFKIVAFTRKDHPKIREIMNATKLEDFRKFKILDYHGDGWGEANLKGYNVERAGSYSNVIKKLAAGRGDVFIQFHLMTHSIINGLKKDPKNRFLALDNLVSSDNAIGAKSFQLLVSKKSPFHNKIDEISETLRAMINEGTVEKIKQSYIK